MSCSRRKATLISLENEILALQSGLERQLHTGASAAEQDGFGMHRHLQKARKSRRKALKADPSYNWIEPRLPKGRPFVQGHKMELPELLRVYSAVMHLEKQGKEAVLLLGIDLLTLDNFRSGRSRSRHVQLNKAIFARPRAESLSSTKPCNTT